MMKITPFKFIVFRILNLTIGRFAFGDKLIRSVLKKLFVKNKSEGDSYCQSAEIFSYDQLEEKYRPGKKV